MRNGGDCLWRLKHRREAEKPQVSTALARKPEPAEQDQRLDWLKQTALILKPQERLYLSLDEARAYSGLPRNYLLKQISEGKLPALKAHGWKIRRGDLEKL